MPSISLFYFFSSHIPYNHADNKGLWDGQRVWATSSLLMSPCEKASPWMDKVLFPLDEILIFFLGLLHFPFLNNRKTGKKKSVCWIFRSNLQDENKVKTSLISFFYSLHSIAQHILLIPNWKIYFEPIHSSHPYCHLSSPSHRLNYFLNFLIFWLCRLQDLSSWTRDWTWAHGSESTKS